ncbi:hypothetical protein MIMGU_mgv1a017569mg [Erythranthe guttata]|uniref:Uncharacterized protein n=1 Tax=Erythranthe guttata TaxID=4155 RepID=A0A022RG45_ERYGU|nr:hypothetical protein MIMGU_mgv1a017569mg [Erythranthe guttata]
MSSGVDLKTGESRCRAVEEKMSKFFFNSQYLTDVFNFEDLIQPMTENWYLRRRWAAEEPWRSESGG